MFPNHAYLPILIPNPVSKYRSTLEKKWYNLNIIDIIHIINMILNFEDIINVADYNQDNSINILDLIFIIDQILG